MLFVFEMANNHQGSVDHAFKIIDEFGKIARENNLSAAIKLQFRQLDTFIHDDFKNSDLKYVKRFRETRLEKSQFKNIIKEIKNNGMYAMATPFDNESLSWIKELDVDIIKIASCSIDDWPLLRAVAKINKRIIISTAGADFETLDKTYSLFKENKRNFSFMHCVGEYPTPVEFSNLNRINLLKSRYSDIEIGISTHESPDQKSIVPYATAMGCKIIEKHVGVKTDEISLNAYSCTPEDMKKVVDDVKFVSSVMMTESSVQNNALKNLKRGIYVKRDLLKDHVISEEDLYFCMPIQKGQAYTADIDLLVGKRLDGSISKDSPVLLSQCYSEKQFKMMRMIRFDSRNILSSAGIHIDEKTELEISAHYGLEYFYKTGALIINKVNREYCKKLIVMQPGQNHPVHHHIKKEETFELLYGDCLINLNGKDFNLKLGSPVVIPRGVNHSFSSKTGCVIEEISTTHHIGDSVYEDPDIFKLSVGERKFYVK